MDLIGSLTIFFYLGRVEKAAKVVVNSTNAAYASPDLLFGEFSSGMVWQAASDYQKSACSLPRDTSRILPLLA